MYVNVVINNKNDNTDNLFTYKVSPMDQEKIHIGSRIFVPFGIGNKIYEAFVFEILNEIEISSMRIKTIDQLIDSDITLNLESVELCKWMKKEYLCRYIDAVNCMLPTGAILKKQLKFILNKKIDLNKINRTNFKEEELKIIDQFKEKDAITESYIKKELKIEKITKIGLSLKQAGIIKIKTLFESEIKTIYQKYIKLEKLDDVNDYIAENKGTTKQLAILKYLKKHDELPLKMVKDALNAGTSTLNLLENKKLVKFYTKEKRRNPNTKPIRPLEDDKIFTVEQKKVFDRIQYSMENDFAEKFLLHGVTGSGKTQVYIKLIEEAMLSNKTAIVLVPEISLTTQIVDRFRTYFGENIAVLHSKLSLGERYDEWKRIENGEVQIVIGARSAIFAPLKNIGIIIIDEEHESSYKSDYTPKYNTIEVAKHRVDYNQAVLVMGTATPSIESYYKAGENEYKLIEMTKRYNENPMPHIDVIDMRDELKKGNKSILSEKLYDALKETLDSGKQSIIFLNRRGYSTFISCRSCGYVVSCPHCDISLTYHKGSKQIECHYCGYKQEPPTICPKCESKYIKYFGVGTEKVEKILKQLFETARIERLDLDTTSKKGSMDRILYAFEEKKIDILIGTQMIAKGLDFPEVTLVGVITADTMLNIPDFRASERTFQLITQVSGRAGRGELHGSVIVQTYEPKHFSLLNAKNYDYQTFYKQEVNLRKAFLYPPFAEIINIIFSGENKTEVEVYANAFSNHLKKQLDKTYDQYITGPNPAPLSKIKNVYRWQLIIKSKSEDKELFKDIINDLKTQKLENYKNINFSIDINPYSLM